MTDKPQPLAPVIEKLKERRKELGLTQDDVCDYAGFPEGRIGHWEAGLATPSISSLIMWAQVLDCRLILGGTPVPDRTQANEEHRLIQFMYSRHISITAST